MWTMQSLLAIQIEKVPKITFFGEKALKSTKEVVAWAATRM